MARGRKVDAPALFVQAIGQKEAAAYVAKFHRHHRAPSGSLFQIGLNDGENLIGVIIVGRPVARLLDDGNTCEVTRCCTDGTMNACSLLYSRARKAAFSLGWSKIITYTLPEEGGASLRASGWVCVGEAGGGSWTRGTRVRADDHPLCKKLRWECSTGDNGKRVRIETQAEPIGLFGVINGEG